MNYKVMIGFVSGALIGGALGAYFMHRHDENEVNNALNEVRRTVVEDIPKTPVVETEEKSDPRPEPYTVIREDYIPTEADKTEYTEEEFEKVTKPEGSITPITEEMYYDESNGFGKESYYYFLNDKTLCSDEYEQILDTDTYVGADLDLRFKRQMGYWDDEEPIYIRNENLRMDYKIVPKEGGFFTGFVNEEGDDY